MKIPLLFIIINTLHTGQGKSGLNCYNWKGKEIPEGDIFVPNGDDPCQKCTCDKGFPTACHSVACSPPPCSPFKQTKGKCCEFTCVDGPRDKGGNTPKDQNPNVTNFERPTNLNTDDAANLSLRLVASTVTTFFIIAIIIFMIHRLRQRRILIMMRRMQQEEEDTVAYVAGFHSVDHGMPPYEDPPPPYTPPKPSDLIVSPLAPPSYERVTASENNNTVIAANGNAVHENGAVANGHLTSALNNQGTSTNQSLLRDRDQSGAGTMLMTSALPSRSSSRAYRHSYAATAVHNHRRCKHGAKKKRHSVGNQTESTGGRVDQHVMSASFTQGVTELENLHKNEAQQRHTLPRLLSDRGVSTEPPKPNIVSANEKPCGSHVLRDSANERPCASVRKAANGNPCRNVLDEELEMCDKANSGLQCSCTENMKQKRYLKRSDSVEIELNNSSPRRCFQNMNADTRHSFRRSYACGEKIDDSAVPCNVRARIEHFESKQKWRNLPQHSRSFDSSVAGYQSDVDFMPECSASLRTMQETNENSSPAAQSCHSDNSQYSLCSETGEMHKSVHSNSESNWPFVYGSESQREVKNTLQSEKLSENEEPESGEQVTFHNPQPISGKTIEHLLNEEVDESLSHSNRYKAELRGHEKNLLFTVDSAQCEVLVNDASCGMKSGAKSTGEYSQEYVDSHTKSPSCGDPIQQTSCRVNGTSFPGEQSQQCASGCLNFKIKSRKDEPETRCDKVKKREGKRLDSPETFRRLSMANEPDNTYTKYGFLDNPNSIEAADVILRDKRIRMKNAVSRKKANTDMRN